MLQKLTVENYAIIDKLEIDFSGKLNVITGETGAGKSIIIGALGLILGDRADTTVLLNREKKCVIEGFFISEGKQQVLTFLRDNDLDIDGQLVLRREINVNGKSRAFVNDTPVNLDQLQELTLQLVDLHQQFESLELTQTDFQREVLDALAGNGALISQYRRIFHQWQNLTREYEEMKNRKLQFNKEADYNQFQFNELEEAGFKENELENLEADVKVLSHSEKIKAELTNLYFELQGSETPIVQKLKILQNQLQPFASIHEGLHDLLHRLQSAHIDLKDIADETDHLINHINYDPKKIEQINDRLTVGYKLLKKHGVQTTAELLQIKQQLEKKLQAVLDIDEEIRKKESELKELNQQVRIIANEISQERKSQIKPLENNVNNLLSQVGMPNAILKVEIKNEVEPNDYGFDKINFLFDANNSNQFLSIRKVTSGGELSRLMLCIKSLIAQSINLPTLIFDEIDTGISGEAARQVGIILKNLANDRQVICITHQPQIAGKADAHFFVFKDIIGNSVKTNIRRLSDEERITTIAKMLSGEKPTAAALENAREMVMN